MDQGKASRAIKLLFLGVYRRNLAIRKNETIAAQNDTPPGTLINCLSFLS